MIENGTMMIIARTASCNEATSLVPTSDETEVPYRNDVPQWPVTNWRSQST